MRATRTAIAISLAILSIGSAPAPIIETRNANDPVNRIEARAEIDAAEIRLSGEVRLTLSIEGPGVLTVTPSKPLLTTPNIWRVREDGLPLREMLDNGRERWKLSYRLSPLVVGTPKIDLAPITIRPGSAQDVVINWSGREPLSVQVATSIESATVDSLRPTTDVEQLPPLATVESSSHAWRFAIIPILLLVSALTIWAARRNRPAPVIRDATWALGQLDATDLSPQSCALILRQFAAQRFSVPGEARTTPEFIGALSASDAFPANRLRDWEALLSECDTARFSGTPTTIPSLANRAKELVFTTNPVEAAAA